MMDGRKLNIVNEKGEVVGEETREKIHQEGLLHREIHVWFFTPEREFVFQHRASDKDLYPDLLDTAVGGHVEIGSDYAETALREITEETGIETKIEKLIWIGTIRAKTFDRTTGRTNNAIKEVFAYCYEGKIEDLRVEKGKAVGFEFWLVEKISEFSEEEKKRFVPGILEEELPQVLKRIKEVVGW